jgi:hypothetical protein
VHVVGGVVCHISPFNVVKFSISRLKRVVVQKRQVCLVIWKVETILSDKIKMHAQASK